MSTRTPSLAARTLPELVTTRQAAVILGVHPATVIRWSAEGRLRRIRLAPKSVRYAVTDLEALIRRGASESATDATRHAS